MAGKVKMDNGCLVEPLYSYTLLLVEDLSSRFRGSNKPLIVAGNRVGHLPGFAWTTSEVITVPCELLKVSLSHRKVTHTLT